MPLNDRAATCKRLLWILKESILIFNGNSIDSNLGGSFLLQMQFIYDYGTVSKRNINSIICALG